MDYEKVKSRRERLAEQLFFDLCESGVDCEYLGLVRSRTGQGGYRGIDCHGLCRVMVYSESSFWVAKDGKIFKFFDSLDCFEFVVRSYHELCSGV